MAEVAEMALARKQAVSTTATALVASALVAGIGAAITHRRITTAATTIQRTWLSHRAEVELGYQPSPLRTIIEDSHGWLLAEGKI